MCDAMHICGPRHKTTRVSGRRETRIREPEIYSRTGTSASGHGPHGSFVSLCRPGRGRGLDVDVDVRGPVAVGKERKSKLKYIYIVSV